MNDPISYTKSINDSTYQFKSDDNTYDAVDFLLDPDNFRSFSEGLAEILHKKELCPKSANSYEMADILFSKLNEIGSDVTHTTVDSWFNEEHRPKIESGYRNQIYEICFALNLSYSDTCWFFQHVYYDRAFNCHTINEAVYYYSIKNSLSYSEAQEIIQEINNAPCINEPQITSSNYTQYVQQQLEDINSRDELIAFLVQNKDNFNSWNQTAYSELNKIISVLLPSEKGKREIANLKRNIKRKKTLFGILPKLEGQKEWGLVLQEYFQDIDKTDPDNYDKVNEDISGKNISSNTFLLDRILYNHHSGISKEVQLDTPDSFVKIPYIVRNNFPSKKTMSDVLSQEKVSHSKSYDSIRKLLILLYFYRFWVEIKLGYNNNRVDDEYVVFQDEINELLLSCGYEEIYAGNPYDWLFLTASKSKKPLQYFRECITDLTDEDK